jgi:hypothetical protein
LSPRILRWWHAEGGEAITFASDADEPGALARGFAEAVDRAEVCGLRPGATPATDGCVADEVVAVSIEMAGAGAAQRISSRECVPGRPGEPSGKPAVSSAGRTTTSVGTARAAVRSPGLVRCRASTSTGSPESETVGLEHLRGVAGLSAVVHPPPQYWAVGHPGALADLVDEFGQRALGRGPLDAGAVGIDSQPVVRFEVVLGVGRHEDPFRGRGEDPFLLHLSTNFSSTVTIACFPAGVCQLVRTGFCHDGRASTGECAELGFADGGGLALDQEEEGRAGVELGGVVVGQAAAGAGDEERAGEGAEGFAAGDLEGESFLDTL